MSEPIPRPPGLPLLGNVNDVDPENSIVSLCHLAEKYGPMFSLKIFGNTRYFVSSVELLDELCDEKRFRKAIFGNLEVLRNASGDGLFTAYHDEPNWGLAHRILTPAFGPMMISNMYDEMYDIATQLVGKWARVGPQQKIKVSDDFTRLALDSIALCTMSKRFNSFYREDMHPFVHAMTGYLLGSGRMSRRTRLQNLMDRSGQRQYDTDVANMRAVAQEVINDRRANPVEKKDFLNVLLYGKDPKTGQSLPDSNIMNNMLTFMIAGHETTSGMLSFTTYYMLRHPEVYQKARQEVDAVVGKGPVRLEHLSKLPYVDAMFREALRLSPPAPGLAFESVNDGPVILGGKYTLPPKAQIVAILRAVASDTNAWTDDAAEYKPERMYGENFEKIPRNSWKPFGNGARSCIGRPFAWQEAQLAMALVLQNFDLRMADPSYDLQIKQTLTIKPDNFEIYASLRDGIDPISLEKKMFSGSQEIPERVVNKKPVKSESGKPMKILYGSNSGTCEGLSQSLAVSAANKGYKAEVNTLDSAVERLSTDQPIVIICSSYEGLPPDNAAIFVEWLKKADNDAFKGVNFAVFGCGHHDWATTFHKVPKMIEELLISKGAKLLVPRGVTDVALNKISDDFDSWQDKHLWQALTDGSDSNEEIVDLDIDVSTGVRATHLRHSVQEALVLDNHLLSAPGAPEKWHMEIKLPTSQTYSAGDYIAILPVNNIQTISRVLRYFKLPFDCVLTLKKGTNTTIPVEREMAVTAILGAYVELNTPATKKNIAVLKKYAPTEQAQTRLDEAASRLISILEIIEAVPEVEVPFSVFLAMLTPMRIRQYSISSSSLKDPGVASITYSVVDNEKGHLGVTTNYLKSLQPGSTIQVSIKKSHTAFHLPSDDSTPVVMLGAGTGFAPFRGFIQERATKLAINPAAKLGPAALFIGCRDPDKDSLYREELAEWESAGAVSVFHAFSKAPERSEGCKYVQDRLYKEKEFALELFKSGARAYICGSAAVGKGIADTVAKIAVETGMNGKEVTHEEALKWWDGLRNERYAVDVFD